MEYLTKDFLRKVINQKDLVEKAAYAMLAKINEECPVRGYDQLELDSIEKN